MRCIKILSRLIIVLTVMLPVLASSPHAASAAGSTPLVTGSLPPAAGSKRIVVSLAQQRVYAYEGNSIVFSTGANIRGARRGTFRVETKMPMARSDVLGWRLPYWLGIYFGQGGIENGFHGYSLRDSGGIATNSLGCIVMPTGSAAKLYRWVPIGTLVVIQ